MPDSLPFQISAEDHDTSARGGSLDLTRGRVNTPFFMPIGTYGAVKTMAPHELLELGAQVVLSNTYHLYLRPGTELLIRTGGLHSFMGWDGPILTDSGGFQIFSLTGLRKIDDDGVNFQSHLDGSKHRFTPENVIDIQRSLGSDFMMVLDECPPGDAPREVWAEAMRRTTVWAGRCMARFKATDPMYGYPQYLLPIVQGGTDHGLRRQSAEELLELGAHAYAVGGLAVGEPKDELFSTLEVLDPILPRDKLRYLMGVGTPTDIVRAVRLGIDMFDCVLPTRNARNGQLFTPEGKINMRNAGYRSDLRPVQEDCDCLLCANFSRAYLRHLLKTGEVLGLRLATGHNLRFYLWLMATIRKSLANGEFASWSKEFLALYEGGNRD
ncbi:tRNA guanosine(34) transglycosylase Tgt [Candidatus Neomarinimicrobiota bacterium]